MIVREDSIEDILNLYIEEWSLELWLIDDPETEEFLWMVDAKADGYHSVSFEDSSMFEVLDRAINFCKTIRWYNLW